MHNALRIPSAALLFVLLSLCACNPQKGRSSAAHGDSLRIVSLVPSVSDQIYDLGGESHLVGCTSYCTRAIADGVPVVSSAIQPNMDLIIAQRPDVVFLSDFIAPRLIAGIEQTGCRTVSLPNPRSYAEIEEQYLIIAEVLGRTELAGQQLQAIRRSVDSLRSVNEMRPVKPRLFMQIAFDPLFGATGSSYMNDLISYAHAVNVAGALGEGPISPEYVIRQDPEVLIIIGEQGSEDPSLGEWEKFRSVTAVRNGACYTLPAHIVSQPSPRHFLESLQLMTEQLSPTAG